MPQHDSEMSEAQPRDAATAPQADGSREATEPATTERPEVDAAYVAKLERDIRKRVGDVAELKKRLEELEQQSAKQREALAGALELDPDETTPDVLVQTVADVARQRDALGESLRREKLTHRVSEAAVAAGAWDRELVLAAIDLETIPVDDDGTVDADAVQNAVLALKQRKPRLFESVDPPVPLGGTKPGRVRDHEQFSRRQIQDPEFYRTHRDAILTAAGRGTIRDA